MRGILMGPPPAPRYPYCHSPYCPFPILPWREECLWSTCKVWHLETVGGDVMTLLPTASERPISAHLEAGPGGTAGWAASTFTPLAYTAQRSWLQQQGIHSLENGHLLDFHNSLHPNALSSHSGTHTKLGRGANPYHSIHDRAVSTLASTEPSTKSRDFPAGIRGT